MLVGAQRTKGKALSTDLILLVQAKEKFQFTPEYFASDFRMAPSQGSSIQVWSNFDEIEMWGKQLLC